MKTTKLITLILSFAAAGALSAQTVTVNPTSLTFSAASNGAAQTQQLSVANSSGAPQFDAYVVNGTWLRITAPGGTAQTSVANIATPANLTITADPTGLAPNIYSGTIAVFGVGPTGTFGATTNVQVTFNVGNLGVSPGSLTFSYQANSGSVPNAATLTLTASAATSYTTSLSGTDCSWLQQPVNGSVTTTATMSVGLVSAAVTGLATGTHTCSLVITPSSGPPITVPVTLTVTPPPTVTYSPSAINLVYQIGGVATSTNSASTTLTINNPGTQALSYFTSPGAPWLTATPDPANPTTIPANGSVNITVKYVTSSNLAPNTYTASLGILIPGATNSPFNIPVSLLVSNSPLLNMSTAPVSFTYQVGGAVPSAKTVTATTTAVDASAPAGNQVPLFVTATTTNGGAWLSCQGLATCTQQQVQGTSFTISLNSSVVQALAAGTYTGTISVFGFNTANATSASPMTIPVTLKVSNDPLVTATFGGCTMGLVTGLTCPLNFPYQVGQNNPTTQTITIGSSTSAALTVTPTATQNTVTGCPANWLSVGAVTSGNNNTSTFTVSANPATVPNGTVCTGNISVAATNPTSGNAAPNGPLTIPVSLYVNNSAMLMVSPTALSFTVAPTQLSTVQNLTVTTTGSTAADQLTFSASRPAGDGWLLVDTTQKSTLAGSVSVAVNSSNLAPGTYTSNITITAAGSGVLDSPITVPVVMTVTGASMSVDKTSLTFNQTVGSAPPASQNVTITATNGSVAYTTAVTTQQGSGWLNATPSGTIASGSTGTVAISVNGSNLAAGTYNGTVTISASGVTGSPIQVAVQLVVAPGTLSVSTNTVNFTEVQNTSAQAQTVNVNGTPGSLNFTVAAATTSGGNWLAAIATSSSTPATVQITASNAGLNPGTYQGTVTVTSAGATGSPQVINVTLTVVAPQTITVSPATLNFSYIIGTQAPATQNVAVSASGNIANFTATVSTNSSWLVVTPTTGQTPATLQVSANPTGLAAGNYTGTIAITSPSSASSPAASITVNLTVAAVPKPVIAAIQNAASAIVGAVSPGENIVIYGTGVGPAGTTPVMGNVVNGALATTVAQTQVFFDGVPAPIYYVSSGQTSVFVPYGIAGRASTQIVVSVQGVQSNAITQTVAATAPGVYTANATGSGPAVAWNYDLSGKFTGINSASIPAVKGGVVSLYVTGEGVTTAPPNIDGALVTNLYKPLANVSATVGGQTAAVQYAGSAPGSIYGVMQVNIQVPQSAPSGTAVPVVINVGGNNSQANVTIAIQ